MRSSALAIAVLGVSLLLTGCPTASNPTQPQSPSSAGTPPAGAGGLPGSGAGGGAGTSSSGAPGVGSAGGTPDGVAGGSGESPVGSIDGAPSGSPSGSGSEPGFGDDVAATQGLPDLRDTQPGRDHASTGAGPHTSDTGGSPAQAGNTAAGSEQVGDAADTGMGSSGAAGNTAGGPLTPEERIAVLEEELARSTGEFDALIVKTQAEQREAARSEVPTATAPANGSSGGDTGNGSGFEGGVADAGGYSTGGGLGGSTGGGVPANSAKYPPPGDIPSGNDDDVVARQLREAAMREPDPAVRERLWDEYRKYKGVTP